MWLHTAADRPALYNLSAFEVVVAQKDPETHRWLVQAMDRSGDGRVLLAETADQGAADNLIREIADRLGVIDLGRGLSA